MNVPLIKCDDSVCDECMFSWRDANANPGCFLQEFIDFAKDLVIRFKTSTFRVNKRFLDKGIEVSDDEK